jgi:Tol biopolymer transport system component
VLTAVNRASYAMVTRPQFLPTASNWRSSSKARCGPFASTMQPQSRSSLLQTRGSAQNLRWSPDGAYLAFVSNRDDHSFIAVYTVASGSVNYLDPSTDLDSNPTWSPDSRRIAFLRIPPDKDALLFVAHRTALPWSIRIADVASGKGHELFRAAEGQGSAFRETDSQDQLHWTQGDRIVFPWERDGWLHLYAAYRRRRSRATHPRAPSKSSTHPSAPIARRWSSIQIRTTSIDAT